MCLVKHINTDGTAFALVNPMTVAVLGKSEKPDSNTENQVDPLGPLKMNLEVYFFFFRLLNDNKELRSQMLSI